MTNTFKTIIAVLVLIAFGLFVYYSKSPAPKEESPIVTEDSIAGCYVATLGQDVYTLKVISQDGDNFLGTLVFKNFEKDSSSGPFRGTYKDGILLGEYTFDSEGMHSVMQTIFKKVGGNFVRGFGDLSADGTHFKDLNQITYDNSVVFKFTGEMCATSLSPAVDF